MELVLSDGWNEKREITWHYVSRDKRITADVEQLDNGYWRYRVILWKSFAETILTEDSSDLMRDCEQGLEAADRVVRDYRHAIERGA